MRSSSIVNNSSDSSNFASFIFSSLFLVTLVFSDEDLSSLVFQGEVGKLLKKMLIAINIKIENVYLSYSVNFRPPEDRKPTTEEIKRYSTFLKEHVSIINPKIIIKNINCL